MRALLYLLAFVAFSSASNLHPRTTPPTSLISTPTPIPDILTAPAPSPTISTCDPTPYADCTPYSNSTFTPPTAHFGPTSPATLRVDSSAEKAVTAALASATSTWMNGPLYPSLKAAVYEAAPSPLQLSLAISGYNWDTIVRSNWYSAVPSQWQDMVTQEGEELQGVFDRVTGEHLMVGGAGGRRGGGGDGSWGVGVVVLGVGIGMGVVGCW